MKCPECGSEVAEDANYCDNCGKDLDKDRSFEEKHAEGEIKHWQSEAEATINFVPVLIFWPVAAVLIWGVVALLGYQEFLFSSFVVFGALIIVLPILLLLIGFKLYSDGSE